MSMLITFIAMYILGYSIDNLSLLAMTLSIGFLVDDAIVFLENAVRRMEAGETAMEATLNGAQEISFTILSMTLSLAAVFIPLVLMPGLLGRQLQEFAVTIIISIIASGVVSLSLTPLMCSRMLAKHEKGTKTWMEKKSNKAIHAVLGVYGRSLNFFLHHKWVSFGIWVVCLVLTVVFFMAVPKSLLPPGDSGFIRGIFQAQTGTSPERMHEYQNKVDKILQDEDAVNIGITVSGLTGRTSASQAFTLGFLKPRDQRQPIDVVIKRLKDKIDQIPGVVAFLQANPTLQISTGATSTTQGKFAYSISGIDRTEVYTAAQNMIGKLQAYPGSLYVANVNSDMKLDSPTLEVNVLRDQASSYGVSAAAILSTLDNAYAQNYVYLIKKSTDEYQVIVEVKDAERTRQQDLEKLYVRSSNGASVPLSAVAQWRETLGPESVNHINQFPSVTIYFALAPGAVLGDATKFVEKNRGGDPAAATSGQAAGRGDGV